MAPNFISRLTTFSLTLALAFAALPASVRAAAPADAGPLKVHAIKFYLDPALAPDMAFAKSVLPKYVADMNTILAKNTNRRFSFDAQTGIILTPTKPQSDSATPPLPVDGFEIWAYAVKSDQKYSYGGYASMDQGGAGVLAGLRWSKLYDPDKLAVGDVPDYTIQLNNMLHELAHIFGAGIGEYYNLGKISDTTGMAPLQNISLSDPKDPFWSARPDFLSDPLLQLTHASTRAAYLAAVRYSNLTAAVMSGDNRNGVASFTQYTVQVLDGNGQPLAGAQVKVWSVSGNAPYPSQTLFDGLTDANGQVLLDWGGPDAPHNSDNFLRLIKVYQDGVSIARPRYVSIYDADIAQLVNGSSALVVTFQQSLTRNVTFASTGANDGWLEGSAKLNQPASALNNTAATFILGDDKANGQYRSILSFDTSALPDNAVITGVSLKIQKQGQSGANPFSTLGALLVDIRKGVFSTSVILQPADFQVAASAVGVAQITDTPDAANWYTAALAPAAYTSVNLSGATQLRLRFNTLSNKNNKPDDLLFYSGDAPGASQPVLLVQYHLP